jgi:hypothetical protein
MLNDVKPLALSKIFGDGIIIKADPAALEPLLQKAQEAPDAILELRRGVSDGYIDANVLIYWLGNDQPSVCRASLIRSGTVKSSSSTINMGCCHAGYKGCSGNG